MEAQLHKIKEEITNAYTALKEFPYHLHAILIHDGHVAD